MVKAAPNPRISWQRTLASICMPDAPAADALRHAGTLISCNRRSWDVAQARARGGSIGPM